jgi:hypothetical protein
MDGSTCKHAATDLLLVSVIHGSDIRRGKRWVCEFVVGVG